MRLLHGSTDLLQPINLLPNSDFSRGGGLPSTITYSSIIGTYTSTAQPIAENWYIASNTADCFKNVTITRAINSLTVSGTCASLASDGLRIFSIYNNDNTNPILTKTCKMKDVTGGISNVVFYNADQVNGVTYYATGTITGSVRVHRPGTYHSIKPTIRINFTQLGNFSFTLYDVAEYEGAYTNPPVYKSLDVQPRNPFLTTTDLIKPIIFKGHTSSAAWHRISMLRNNAENPGRDTYVHQEFIFGKNGGSSRGCICKIIAHIIKVSSNKRFVLRGESFTYNGSNVTKLRLAYDPVNTGYLFVEAYAPLTTGDSYFVNYIVNSSCYSFGSDGLVLNGNPVIPNISILSQDASNDIVLEGTETAVNEPTDMKAYTSTVY